MDIDPVITAYGRELAEQVGKSTRDFFETYENGILKDTYPVHISSPSIRTIMTAAYFIKGYSQNQNDKQSLQINNNLVRSLKGKAGSILTKGVLAQEGDQVNSKYCESLLHTIKPDDVGLMNMNQISEDKKQTKQRYLQGLQYIIKDQAKDK